MALNSHTITLSYATWPLIRRKKLVGSIRSGPAQPSGQCPIAKTNKGRSRHNYRLSHQTQISRNTYIGLCQFLGGVFSDFAILRDQLSVFGSEVTSRHHSFFVTGKLTVTQCQWRITLLIIALLVAVFFCEMSHSLVRPLPFAFQYIGGIYIHQGKGSCWQGKGVTSPQISIFIYIPLASCLKPAKLYPNTDRGKRLNFNIYRA